MAKTTNLYVRVEPGLKGQTEATLSEAEMIQEYNQYAVKPKEPINENYHPGPRAGR